MSEIILNHKNCQIIAYRNLLKFKAICHDEATFERVKSSYNSLFSGRISENGNELEMQCKTEMEYQTACMVFEIARQQLILSEPEKMIEG